MAIHNNVAELYQICYISAVARNWIREARRRANLTQEELAERLGTTQSAVARWEKGDVSPRLDTFEKVAAACGLALRLVPTRRRSGVPRRSA
jgi:transcriptional regulator with XRE-family HTH domain